ncbi:SETMAR [Cordylochernes scorpioides]|uniref:SETMAR n=1 Tax=Cordylochernes scorpioides TaxID=51811 RepID=A0ABY6KRA7_9ARAC|nr:SETMAR [Cordylochernes scorpioides]
MGSKKFIPSVANRPSRIPLSDFLLAGCSDLRKYVILLHEFKLGRSATETTRNIISAWGKGVISERKTRRWFEKFRNGDTSLREGRGRPSVVDDDYLKSIIDVDTNNTTREILYDNLRRSAQWLNRDAAPKHFPKPKLHQKKIMVIILLSRTGLIHHSFLNHIETITAVRLVNRKGPILLHDNTIPHVSMITRQKLNELGHGTLDHPPFSPDLSPTDYHFFRHLTTNFMGGKCSKGSRNDSQ